MPSISVLPGIGTVPVNVAAGVQQPGGAAVPSHVAISAIAAPLTPMTEATAQAFAAAVAALSAVLLPQ